MKIVLASHNDQKIKELSIVLKDFKIDLIPQSELEVPDVEETGLSFVENALIKARHTALLTKLPAIADDSGLVVPSLGGAPGIYSARYAGKQATDQDNITKLLSALKDFPDEKRIAYFYCVLVFMADASDPMPLICEGSWAGIILRETKGENGFGYDPVFYDTHLKKSAAELSLAHKNNISHRGSALRSLISKLSERMLMER